jgi:hypothetical protein
MASDREASSISEERSMALALQHRIGGVNAIRTERRHGDDQSDTPARSEASDFRITNGSRKFLEAPLHGKASRQGFMARLHGKASWQALRST